MRVFITGATGYIGSAVVEALQRSGHDVVGLARSEQAAEALKRAGCEPHLGDITDPAGLTAALAGADAVVHTAVGTGGGIVGDAGECLRRTSEGARWHSRKQKRGAVMRSVQPRLSVGVGAKSPRRRMGRPREKDSFIP